MKKLLLLVGLVVFLNNCAPQTYNEFKADSSYKYYAKAKSYSGTYAYQVGSVDQVKSSSTFDFVNASSVKSKILKFSK